MSGIGADRAEVVFHSPGHRPDNVRLQPWAYLGQLAQGLADAGHDVTILGAKDAEDGHASRSTVLRRGVRLMGGPSARLAARQGHRPRIAVWSLGPTSLLRERAAGLRGSADKVVAIVPGPWYSLRDLRQAGAIGLGQEQRDHVVHAAAAIVPASAFGAFLSDAADAVVVPTMDLAAQMQAAGLEARRVHVVPFGKDPVWDQPRGPKPAWLEDLLGAAGNEHFAVNFGPVRAVRGVHELADAARAAGVPCLFLVRSDRGDPGTMALRRRVPDQAWVHEGALRPEELRAVVAHARLAALPFRLVQSVVPAAVLESLQAGVPVVTTDSRPLPQLVGEAGDSSSRPRDAAALADALARVWDPAVRARCAQAARHQMAGYPTAREAGARFARVVAEVA